MKLLSLSIIIAAVIVVGGVWVFAGGGLEWLQDRDIFCDFSCSIRKTNESLERAQEALRELRDLQ